VSGNVYVPDACGGTFYYAVTGFGGFVEGIGNEEESVHQALSVYLGTILFGLRAARNFLWSLYKEEPCRSVPTFGLAVMIGKCYFEKLRVAGKSRQAGLVSWQLQEEIKGCFQNETMKIHTILRICVSTTTRNGMIGKKGT
jgi:hypothetical protein